MAKRQIRIQIQPDGSLKVDNQDNPDEKRILAELEELAEVLSGDKKSYKVEEHVHSHGHSHAHDHSHDHLHTGH